jgi:hypothetical protein
MVVVEVGEEERPHVPKEGRRAGAAVAVAVYDRFSVKRLGQPAAGALPEVDEVYGFADYQSRR